MSDEEGMSRADTPDLSKLTARQRAKLGDVSHEYMKLSDGKRLTSSLLPCCCPQEVAANTASRGPSQEALHRRRAVHAPRRNGPS